MILCVELAEFRCSEGDLFAAGEIVPFSRDSICASMTTRGDGSTPGIAKKNLKTRGFAELRINERDPE